MRSLRTLPEEGLRSLLALLRDSAHLAESVDEAAASASGAEHNVETDSAELLQVLQGLQTADLLPCLCFHRSYSHVEELFLGIGERIVEAQREEAQRKTAHAENLVAWRAKRGALLQQLNDERKRAQEAAIAPDDNHVPLADMWGHVDEGQDANNPRAVARGRRRADPESDETVRAIGAAIEALQESCPAPLAADGVTVRLVDFRGERPKHVYQSEIELLLEHIEAELHELGKRRSMRWAGGVGAALRHGVAMHFEDGGSENLNFAVQLLFRIGYVRVLLTSEALACGVNLPCRATVILDSEIQGSRLTQMAGRAGRRGFDMAGATIFLHNLGTLRRMYRG